MKPRDEFPTQGSGQGSGNWGSVVGNVPVIGQWISLGRSIGRAIVGTDTLTSGEVRRVVSPAFARIGPQIGLGVAPRTPPINPNQPPKQPPINFPTPVITAPPPPFYYPAPVNPRTGPYTEPTGPKRTNRPKPKKKTVKPPPKAPTGILGGIVAGVDIGQAVGKAVEYSDTIGAGIRAILFPSNEIANDPLIGPKVTVKRMKVPKIPPRAPPPPQRVIIERAPAAPGYTGPYLSVPRITARRMRVPTVPARAPAPTPPPKKPLWQQLLALSPAILPLIRPSQGNRTVLRLQDPLTPPSTGGLPLPQVSTAVSPYAQAFGYGAASGTGKKSCVCTKRKRGPKKKRTVCYAGSYTERASGLSKRKRRRVPCK